MLAPARADQKNPHDEAPIATPVRLKLDTRRRWPKAERLVWMAPAFQGICAGLACFRGQSCVRPVGAVMTAGRSEAEIAMRDQAVERVIRSEHPIRRRLAMSNSRVRASGEGRSRRCFPPK